MTLSRRHWFQVSGAAAVGVSLPAPLVAEPAALPAPISALEPEPDLPPISLEERRARIARAQRLMTESGLDAVVIASGTSLLYFTGARWGLSERFFGVVLTREGPPAWVTPAFEKKRAEEQIQLGGDIRAWEEHESPYALVASILADRKIKMGKIGVEETMPFAFASGLGEAAPAARVALATPVTAGCRMIKDGHEIDLMRRACQNTVRAHRALFESLKEGMTREEVARLSAAAHTRLGMRGGALVLFGKDAAFPHGTTQPEPLKAGDVVLVDGGGRYNDYASDITRTGVFGAAPTDRQRKVWDIVREAQRAAFEVARPGVECQAVDAAARKVLEEAGFGPDYSYLTHRVGHGIGMDGHEWTYLVRGNQTKLRPGMCFSDEPGIYIYGEMGIRHEDIIYITDDAAANMTAWTGSPEEPAV